MKTTLSRNSNDDSWPREVQPGRAVVRVYRRTTPQGNFAYMVANYADGKRRFDSYASEPDALAAADKLARRIDARDYVAASMTREQAIEYASAVEKLKPFNVTVDAATSAVAECLKTVGDLSNLHAAVKFYAARNKQIVKTPVSDVVVELLKIKKSRGASERYQTDLKRRLERFAGDCKKDASTVTTADVQEWLDALKLSSQSYANYRTVLHTFFEFAVARSYAADNPVAGTERIKIRNGDIELFTPLEIGRLLTTADAQTLPCLALGAFAGLRTAEIVRLEWSDIHLDEKFIVVSASKSKTASRRIVPIHDNLFQWLTPYKGHEGKIWHGTAGTFNNRQRDTAAATRDLENGITAVKWKRNGLRHSYASYRFAQIMDAGRVAGELGNSAAVIHRHYRELVKPADAVKWFTVAPEQPANVIPAMAAAS